MRLVLTRITMPGLPRNSPLSQSCAVACELPAAYALPTLSLCHVSSLLMETLVRAHDTTHRQCLSHLQPSWQTHHRCICIRLGRRLGTALLGVTAAHLGRPVRPHQACRRCVVYSPMWSHFNPLGGSVFCDSQHIWNVCVCCLPLTAADFDWSRRNNQLLTVSEDSSIRCVLGLAPQHT